jgi:hypothetical protein
MTTSRPASHGSLNYLPSGSASGGICATVGCGVAAVPVARIPARVEDGFAVSAVVLPTKGAGKLQPLDNVSGFVAASGAAELRCGTGAVVVVRVRVRGREASALGVLLSATNPELPAVAEVVVHMRGRPPVVVALAMTGHGVRSAEAHFRSGSAVSAAPDYGWVVAVDQASSSAAAVRDGVRITLIGRRAEALGSVTVRAPDDVGPGTAAARCRLSSR